MAQILGGGNADVLTWLTWNLYYKRVLRGKRGRSEGKVLGGPPDAVPPRTVLRPTVN